MSPHTTPTPTSTVNANEIDLFELIQSLWQEKVLVVIMTAIFTVLALAYALLATPIYQTQATLVPPPAYAIQGYNEGRMEAFQTISDKDRGKDKESVSVNTVKIFTVDDVYQVFKNNLNSLQLRNRFFDEVYVPSLTAEERESTRESLLRQFNSILSVTQGSPQDNPDLYRVSVELDDPETAADWVKQYIDYAIAATKLEIKSNIEAEQKLQIDALTVKAASLLQTAQKERQDQINLLKEALYIAESIGLEIPTALSDKASLGGARYIDNDLIYTRGAKTLRAQLQILENRVSDEPFIKGYRELKTHLGLLKAYTLDDTQTSVVVVDEAAEVPTAPIKPKKTMIVAVGIVLGGMLGIFVALVRIAIRARKKAL